MLKPKTVDFNCMIDVDYNFNQCNQKDEITKILDNSTPLKPEEISTQGSSWYFDNIDIGIYSYTFCINGADIYISDITESVNTLFDFLEYVAYYDDKKLMVTIHDEGVYQALTAFPVDKNKIRFTIFAYQFLKNKEILLDVIVDKFTLLSKFKDLIKNIVKDLKENEISYEELGEDFEHALEILEEYCHNPKQYKKNHILPHAIRLFNVAYKKTNCDWEFDIFFESDEKCEKEYWEKLKQESKILKYDLEEDIPIIKNGRQEGWGGNSTVYDLACNREVNINRTKKATMKNRVRNKNWCYSTETKKWYSTNEIMSEPKTGCIILGENFQCFVEIDSSFYSEEYEIESYIKGTNEEYEGLLDCNLILEDKNGENYKFEFDYRDRYKIFDILKKLEVGTYARLPLWESKIHFWTQADNKLSIACIAFSRMGGEYQKDELKWHILVEKDSFIKDFLNGLAEIERKIKSCKGG